MTYSSGADHRPVGERTYSQLVETENEAIATNWDGNQERHLQNVADERNRRDDNERTKP